MCAVRLLHWPIDRHPCHRDAAERLNGSETVTRLHQTANISRDEILTSPLRFIMSTTDRTSAMVYTTTMRNIAARFHRLCGDEVFFLTGTDEHAGEGVDSAAEHGMTPHNGDQNAQAFQETFAKLGHHERRFHSHQPAAHKEKAQQYMTSC